MNYKYSAFGDIGRTIGHNLADLAKITKYLADSGRLAYGYNIYLGDRPLKAALSALNDARKMYTDHPYIRDISGNILEAALGLGAAGGLGAGIGYAAASKPSLGDHLQNFTFTD